MWPKALAQLIELLPHLSRLLPMADRFLASKTADQEANTRAMQQMAEGLRGDLGQVTASHAGLYRQLNDQSEKLSVLSSELNSTKLTLNSLDARLDVIEPQLKILRVLLTVTLLVLLTILYFVIHLSLRH